MATARSNQLSISIQVVVLIPFRQETSMATGDRTFQATVNYNSPINPYSVVTGDLNGDGHADLAVANISSNDVSVLRGNGDGTFQTAMNYTAGSFPIAVSAGDFNG